MVARDDGDLVVELTQIAIAHGAEIEGVFDAELDPHELKRTVVESIHESVIEEDIDSVQTGTQEVGTALGGSTDPATSDCHELPSGVRNSRAGRYFTGSPSQHRDRCLLD